MEVEKTCLQLIKDGCSGEEYTSALQTLQRIHKNIDSNPDDEKYRKLKKENKNFSQRVWKHDGAQQFLLAAGWVEVDESIVLFGNDRVTEVLCLLDDALRTSEVSHPVKSAPSAAASSSWSDRELSDREKQIAEDRKRVLEKMKRDKEERKRISEQIKADRRDTNTREVKESKGKELNFGATVKQVKSGGG